MNINTFSKSIINIVSIPLLALSLYSYYQVEFYLFLLLATLIVIINFNNYWYIHWIVLVFLGPILSNIFFDNTLGSLGKAFISNIILLLVGALFYYFLVSLIKHFFQYLNRKKVIRIYRESLNSKILSIITASGCNNIDFNLDLVPLSSKLKINDEIKVKLLGDLYDKFNSQLKTLRFKDVLFGNSNQKFLSSIKKYLEIKDLLNNYRISNSTSVMSIFINIRDIFEKNNISLERIEKIYKSMDYEVITKLEENFLSDCNSCILNPPKTSFIKGLVGHTSFKYFECIQLTIDNSIIELEDIIISNTGIFLVKEYYEPINMHNLKVDINGVWVKFYNTGEIEIDKDVHRELTSKAGLLKKFINLKLAGTSIQITPIILVDHKNLSIENQSPIKIIPSTKLEETIENYQSNLSIETINSVTSIVSSLVPEFPTYDYELPSPNMLNLIQLGLFTMKLIDELHTVLLDETSDFINKYKP